MQKDYKAKSHYLAMRKWVFDAVKEQQVKRNYSRSQDAAIDWSKV